MYNGKPKLVADKPIELKQVIIDKFKKQIPTAD